MRGKASQGCFAGVFAVCALVMAGCAGSGDGGNGGAATGTAGTTGINTGINACVVNSAAQCLCNDGTASTQVCGADGLFGLCACDQHGGAMNKCVAQSTAQCLCQDGTASTQTCDVSGVFGACACELHGGGMIVGGGTAGTSGAAGINGGTAGIVATAGISGGTAGIGGDTAGVSGGTAGVSGDTAGVSGGTAGVGGGDNFIREADPTEQSVKSMGEYTVKSYTEKDGLVGGMAYGAAATGGDSAQLYYPENATPPFASIVIVPGFTAQRSDIAPWCPFLASHGIVCLAIDTNTTGDQPPTRSTGLLDAIESLKKENMREGSPVKGKLDTTRFGLMGWSMGGGGTWISADAHPELKVAISLCGWITMAVGSQTTVPSMQLAVKDDQLAAGMSQPVYNAIPSGTPKMLIEWASGGHWIANDPKNASWQNGRYGLSWIKVHMEGDTRYAQFLKTTPTGTSDFKTNFQ